MTNSNTDMPFRNTKSKKEILSYLKKIKNENEQIMLWQNQDGDRIKVPAFVGYINEKKKTVSFRPARTKRFFFSKPLEIYAYAESLGMVFKGTPNLVMEESVEIIFPEEIRIIENRDRPRINFRRRKIEATIKKDAIKNKIPQEFVCRLLDISQTGAAIVIYSHDLSMFSTDSHIKLTNVDKMLIFPYITGIVVYRKQINPTGGEISRSFRVGVNFDKPLTQEQILELSTI